MKHFVFFVFTSSLLCCCKVAEEFNLQRMIYIGSDLRMDGYYYMRYEDGYCSFFLYKNGLFLSNGCSNDIESLAKLDLLLSDSEFQERKNKNQFVWGIYKILGNKVIIERWEPWNDVPYKVKRSEGDILNDTQISTSAMKNLEVYEVYQFREFSIKPDSTNTFIK